MSKNLNDLNDVLFETLEGVKSGKMSEKQAQTVVNVGNAIINNAKIQLQAFKLTKGKTAMSLLSPNKDPKIKLPEKGVNNRSKAVLDYAIEKGYKNVAEAIAVMGKTEFDKGVSEYMKDE
jgi:hypothetical protein